MEAQRVEEMDPDQIERQLSIAKRLAREASHCIGGSFGMQSQEAAQAMFASALHRLVDAAGIVAQLAKPEAPGGIITPTGRGYRVVR